MTHGQQLGSRVFSWIGRLFRSIKWMSVGAVLSAGLMLWALHDRGWLHVAIGPPASTSVTLGDDSEIGTGLGVSGRGQAYGIFVSLSEFPRGADAEYRNLPGHARLAREVADSFLRARIMHPDHAIVLMEGEATPENFHAAVEQMLGRVTRDDLFIVYFATHGGEGHLEMHDGVMLTADEMRNDLRNLRAGQALFIADACYSGSMNFAAPSPSTESTLWHGLYSTTDRTPSYGEYLSHALIAGIGEVGADDGSVTLDDLFVAVQADLATSTLPLTPERRDEMRANIMGDGRAVLWRTHRRFIASTE
jgi:hypothetical protein